MATRSSAVTQNVQRSTNKEEIPIKEEKESLWANQLLPARSEMSPRRFVVLPPMHILEATACVGRAADDSDVHTCE